MLPLEEDETIDARLLKLSAQHKELGAKRRQLADDLHDTTVQFFEAAREIDYWRIERVKKENPNAK